MIVCVPKARGVSAAGADGEMDDHRLRHNMGVRQPLFFYIKGEAVGKQKKSRELTDKEKKLLGMLQDPGYVPMKQKELALFLCSTQEDKKELARILSGLLEEGRIRRTKRGRYEAAAQTLVLRGTYLAGGVDFGFIQSKGRPDVYVSGKDRLDAFHQDEVEFVVEGESKGKKQRGRILRILSRGLTRVVGAYDPAGEWGFVVCDDKKLMQDVYIPKGRAKGAKKGDKVVVRLTSYGKNGKSPEGVVTEVLGKAYEKGVDMESLIKRLDLPEEFPGPVLEEARELSVPVSKDVLAGRRDLRSWQIVTIDGDDAKDLDDGVSLTCEDGTYELGVHIADVSHYVAERSALDKEALKRGTSVYLPDRVIPMLPKELSNGICSLNEGEDRLALSCLMTFDGKGKLLSHEIVKSVIRVSKRMTYHCVAQILSGAEDTDDSYSAYVPLLGRMEELSGILRRRRQKRGAIDFHFPEAKIILDEKGDVKDIELHEDNAATRLIEDFMLAANETVAEDFFWRELPFVYRIHETPDKDKLRQLSRMATGLGCRLQVGEHVYPKQMQTLLFEAEEKGCDGILGRLALRSMQQAVYAPENKGHFGLAAPYYTHFTSPIRRYPDLQIHRIIKDAIDGRMDERRQEHYSRILESVSSAASRLERRAAEAEREAVKIKKAKYIKKRIGHVYEGVISGVTGWGFYVELPNTVEGLVHVGSLRGDYYTFDEEACRLVGERTGRVYSLGMRVTICVAGCDTVTGTVDFDLADEEMRREETGEEAGK